MQKSTIKLIAQGGPFDTTDAIRQIAILLTQVHPGQADQRLDPPADPVQIPAVKPGPDADLPDHIKVKDAIPLSQEPNARATK